jgi:PAS domain S-box-containing protein
MSPFAIFRAAGWTRPPGVQNYQLSEMNHPIPEDPFRQEAQARLAAIVESSDDAIVSKTLEGIITTWNSGAVRIFGYTAAEAIGRSITMLVPNDRQDEEPQILARLRVGERVDHYETVRVRKDGRLIEVSVTISPIRDGQGRIIGASKIARDITDQKRFQAELRAAKEAAEAANRAKDHFLSVLSHELRTPLTPVLAAVSALSSSQSVRPEEWREHLDMIRRNVETEARLVDDLLDLTRIARGMLQLHFEVSDAHAALRNAVTMFQAEIDAKRLAVTFALHARDYHVWADAGRLQQVFLNLLSNAVKFTPDEGSILVRSSNDGGRLTIEVSDNGIGIDADVLPRLFSAFEQGERSVHRRFGGLGLGLSIVRSLMELHKGSVTASSGGKNKGATFVISLATVAAAPARAAEPAGPHPGKTPVRILLVEDHQDTRNVLARLLTKFGCAVTAAGSVKEALAVSDGREFDLLVSDIGLPDGTGMDVMRHMRKNTQLKGIALSGFGQDEDLRQSREAGFETHLTKPVNFQMLRDVIERLAVGVHFSG